MSHVARASEMLPRLKEKAGPLDPAGIRQRYVNGIGEKWWALQDSNLWPPACEAGDLAADLSAQPEKNPQCNSSRPPATTPPYFLVSGSLRGGGPS